MFESLVGRNRGFTLIEILVVTSIISLLSSIVLTSINVARDKGRIAAGQAFSSHNINALGAYSAGWWDFDESSGNALDSSGVGNVMVLQGTAGRTTNTFNGKGNAFFSTSAVNSYARVVSPINLPTGSTATVEAWIFPTGYSDTTYNGIVSWGPRLSSDSFLLSIQNSGRLSVATWNNDVVPISGRSVPLNKWSHVAATLSGSSVKFYIDGALVAAGTLPLGVPNIQAQGPLNIGATDANGNRGFIGAIDEVHIYQQALAVKDIEKHYAMSKAVYLASNKVRD